MLAFVLMASGHALPAQIQINEVMQSNVDCIMDDLNEFPDSWVELYNAGPETIDLTQYLIGTKADGSNAWRMSLNAFAPQSYTLVYCDKEETGMHTSFDLETGKDCRVYIFNNDLTIVDSLHIENKQPAPNISYGRINTGSEEWGYQYKPTPSAANCGIICTEILGEPIFSEAGRVMTSEQTLSLSLSLPEDTPEGTVIRYTTNGDEPTESSTLYQSPIEISSNKLIRAKLFCQGFLSPRSTTHSYLYLDREMTLPIVSIVSKNAYFKDNKIGILVWGTYDSEKHNYEYDWRRPINFEFFTEPDSASQLNLICETRVSGGVTRKSNALKSMTVYTKKRFGHKHFKYEFWPDQRPGQKNLKSFVLRDAGNDFDYLYMRDAIIQRSVAQNVDLDWQAWRPSIVFINGEYKGILNFRERSNENNIYTNYDQLEDIDLIERWTQLKQGTMDNWNDFHDFYNNRNHTREEYAERMDIEEFMNLMIMNIFYNNQDFPGNNFVAWRPREEGGRWRFIAKDTDLGMGLYRHPYAYNTLEWLYNPNYDPDRNWANYSTHTKLFRRLMAIDEISSEFIDRSAIYMGDFLNFDAVWKIWGPMYEEVKTEYPHHRKLFNESWPVYSEELTWAQNWVKQRPDFLYSHYQSFFDLGEPVKLTINQDSPSEEMEGISIAINGVKLSQPTFNGKFFVGREVTLTSSPMTDEEGLPITSRVVTSWKVDIYTSASNHSTQTYNGSSCQFVMPSGEQVKITAQYGEEQGLEQLTNDPTAPALYYDLNGHQLDHPQPGINIVRDSDGQTRKVIL